MRSQVFLGDQNGFGVAGGNQTAEGFLNEDVRLSGVTVIGFQGSLLFESGEFGQQVQDFGLDCAQPEAAVLLACD